MNYERSGDGGFAEHEYMRAQSLHFMQMFSTEVDHVHKSDNRVINYTIILARD